MALKQYFLGSIGPLYYNDTEQAPGAPAGVFQAPFYVPDGAASNHVWTSDGFGRGFWQSLLSGGLPAAHASTHYAGQSDPVDLASLGGVLVVAQFNSGTGATLNTLWHGDMSWSKVALADMADMATASVFYRKTALSGAPEVQTLATLKTDLGLTGTNSGDQTITLTGDVTGSGTGTFATTIGALKVTNAMLAGSIDLTTKVTGILPIANGGTGSSTQNFVDLTTIQSVAGAKTFTTSPLTLTAASGTIRVVDTTGQFQVVPTSGGALMRLDPKPFDTASTGEIALFRVTNTVAANYPRVTIYKGDNTATIGALIIPSGTPTIAIYDGSGNVVNQLQGGTCTAGKTGTTRGVLQATRGSGTNTPGVLQLEARSGTEYYFWVTDSGALRHHTSLPTADTDGGNVPSALKSFILSASSIIPGTTGGCGTPTQKEAGTSLANYYTASFDKDTANVGYWMFNLPDDYDGGTVVAYVTWECVGGAASKLVNFEVSGVAYANDVAITTAFGTAQDSIDTWLHDSYFHISPATAVITLGGTPAAGNLCCIKLRRDAADATNDDLAANALVSCVRIKYTPLVL